MTDQKVDDAFANLLDTSLDDIDDLPEYLDGAPNGAYHLAIVEAEKKVVEKEENGVKTNRPVFQVTYEVVKIAELSKPEELETWPIKTREADGKGSYFNESFWFDRDPKKSLEILKAKFKEVATKFGFTTMEQVLTGLKGLEVMAVVKTTKDDKKDKYYIQTRNVMPL